MKWQRKYPKYASFEIGSKKPEHFYEAETEQGFFALIQRNALTRSGRPLKSRQWVLWVNGKPVSGSRRYRLRDAKDFAKQHLADLRSYAERRNNLTK